MRLRAKSRRSSDRASYVEIGSSGDGAFFLFYFDANGECFADTWHETVEGAKQQARFELEIGDADWEDVT